MDEADPALILEDRARRTLRARDRRSLLSYRGSAMQLDLPPIRQGVLADAALLADAFRQMWLDNAVSPEEIEEDYRQRVERFVHEGSARDGLRFFLAEREGAVVGSACCQRFAGLYPAILRATTRRYGYVWGVWVAPSERRRGLGQRLTETCVDALRAAGCTHVLLHAAPSGRAIYERMGFQSTNELRLSLLPTTPALR